MPVKRKGGWIGAPESDRDKIEKAGIKIGGYADNHGCFIECEADEQTIEKFKSTHPSMLCFFPMR